MVIPEIDAVTPASIWNTRLSPPPLTFTPTVGPEIVSIPVVLLSSSWLPARVIVFGVPNTELAKLIVLAPAVKFARPIAWRRSDLASDGYVGGVVHDERGGRHQRSSSTSRAGGTRRAALRMCAWRGGGTTGESRIAWSWETPKQDGKPPARGRKAVKSP